MIGAEESWLAELLRDAAYQSNHVTRSWCAAIDAQAQQPSGEALPDRRHAETQPEGLHR